MFTEYTKKICVLFPVLATMNTQVHLSLILHFSVFTVGVDFFLAEMNSQYTCNQSQT